jgi:hypothetical protein
VISQRAQRALRQSGRLRHSERRPRGERAAPAARHSRRHYPMDKQRECASHAHSLPLTPRTRTLASTRVSRPPVGSGRRMLPSDLASHVIAAARVPFRRSRSAKRGSGGLAVATIMGCAVPVDRLPGASILRRWAATSPRSTLALPAPIAQRPRSSCLKSRAAKTSVSSRRPKCAQSSRPQFQGLTRRSTARCTSRPR